MRSVVASGVAPAAACCSLHPAGTRLQWASKTRGKSPSGPGLQRARREVVTPDQDPDEAQTFDPSIPFREAKRRAMEQWERWYVLTLLEYTHGNLSRASRVAQTDRTYLRKLYRRYSESDAPLLDDLRTPFESATRSTFVELVDEQSEVSGDVSAP